MSTATESNVAGVVMPVAQILAQIERRLDAQEKRIGALYVERERQSNAQLSAANTLIEVLGELRHIRHALGDSERSRSSVEIKSGTNGRPFDLCVKAYESSEVLDAESAALQSFMRLRTELEERLMANFKATVEAKGK